MGIQTDLLREIDAFCAATKMAETTFGRMAVNDGKFVARIRAGGGLTLATYERVRSYIAAANAGAGTTPPTDAAA